jgi:hypothetical protein
MPETDPESPHLKPGSVAELQGLYGAFTFPERLLQQIWQRGDYDGTAAATQDGRSLHVRYPGRWNHLGGPDFAGARLLLDGREVTGDVELHLHAEDWETHGHAADPAYAQVRLHVVLFPIDAAYTRGSDGGKIPILCLLPRLHHGLEEYATEAAIEHLAGRPLDQAQETLGALGAEALASLLEKQAAQRWRSKVHFAGQRLQQLGWAGACHHAALEILGYRFNRVPMLRIATAHPLGAWVQGRVDPEPVFATEADHWSVQGVRPLNHPRLRLRQYAAWCRARPAWVERLRDTTRWTTLKSGPPAGELGAWRRRVQLGAHRTRLMDELCAGSVRGARFDNLMADGFLPLLAAETGADLAGVWAGWFAGDAPERVARVLTALGVFDGRARPRSQGPVQGLLGWLVAHEKRTALPEPRTERAPDLTRN